MQTRKRIVGITIAKTVENCYPSRHEIILSFEDITKKKIMLNGEELSNILNKNFNNISMNGPLLGYFQLETRNVGDEGSVIHQESLMINEVLALFNSRGHLEKIDDRENLFTANDNNIPKFVTQSFQPHGPRRPPTEEELKIINELENNIHWGELKYDEERKMCYFEEEPSKISLKR
jgi:hypothetical protein